MLKNSINKNIQNILNAFEKLFRYTHVDQDSVIDEFDKIIRLLYESKINDSEYNHNLLVQNLVKTLEMLLEDINYYLLDSNSLKNNKSFFVKNNIKNHKNPPIDPNNNPTTMASM